MPEPRVVERVDDFDQVTDHPSTYEAAETIAGHRLDRRRRYAIIKGEVCELARWSQVCSGCVDGGDHPFVEVRGAGCHECGYTGRGRVACWLPLEARNH